MKEQNKKAEPTKMICKFCDYEWTTMSKLDLVCCPNCLNKNEKNQDKNKSKSKKNNETKNTIYE